MAYRFTARAVAAETDGDGELQAGVAEEDEGFFLLFTSTAGEPSAQEISLGFDTYCVITPDQSTAYGCVREVALAGTLLTVSLDPGCLDDLEAEMCEVLARVLTSGREEARPRLTGFPM
ncbi:hypothetical protein [Streptomyces sp. NPDC048560]|uniref:hypothetical protein n=1 Tax=Streptomyces sp. NPDC048560 TaxID=3155488 RepID=UPI003431EAC2